MATLSVSWTIDDAKVAGIKNDFAAYYGWTATIKDAEGEDIPNPEGQNAFIKRKLGEIVKEAVKTHRCNTATVAAKNTSLADTEANVILT